jgi:predicted ArsR family transcriptional regulator
MDTELRSSWAKEASMQRTRRQILDILKKRGRATLEELSQEVGLSPVTVRVHLSVLQRDDLLNVDEVRGKVGRPYFVYSLSEEAENLFPKRYHLLANRLLSSMDDLLPADTMDTVMRDVAAKWARERGARMAGKSLEDRVEEVARIRTEEGAMAEWERMNGGYLLTQYNCAHLAVSRTHDRICRMEQAYLSQMLGASVTRETRIGGGDRVCSYMIRPLESDSAIYTRQ